MALMNASRLLCLLSLVAYLPCTVTQATSQRLLLILLDGFRFDYLNRTSLPLPGFDKLAKEGVKVGGLVPEFPSLSVPNWYSLMTGLHSAWHGMTGNHMYDVANGESFLFTKYPHALTVPQWWQGGDPLWITAVRQNKKSHMWYWPGCEEEIRGLRPTFCQKYTGLPTLREFQSALSSSLSLLQTGQTDVSAIYYQEIDHIGHLHGPFSAEINEAIREVDPIMSDLVDRLSDPALSEVNLMVFSDHGMTEISTRRIIDISEVLEPSDYITVLEGAPLANIYTTPDKEEEVYNKLRNHHPNLTVYRKSDLPERWNFKHGPYVAPLIAVADLGWFIKTPEERGMSRALYQGYQGMHGYDNTYTEMQGIFMAMGPAFKAGQEVNRLRSVDLYQVMCHILDIRPSPHNGTRSDVTPLLNSDGVGGSSVILLSTLVSVVVVSLFICRKRI